jgi:hypothetical protein
MSALERAHFHSAHSLAEVMGVPCSTTIRHLRDLLGRKLPFASSSVECHMS